MSPKLLLFVASFVVWCVFDWVPDGATLVVGVVAAAIVAFLLGDLVIRQRPHPLRRPQRYFYFLFEYMPVFLWLVLKSNLDVAYRVLHPALPINPGIVKVRTSLRSEIACTLLANSITLTPGTMSVDLDSDRGILYVHCIDVPTEDTEAATRNIVEPFEKILRRIFE